MKKRYIIVFLSIITAIAYIDLVDSCKKIDKVTAQTFETSHHAINYDKALNDFISGYFKVKK